MLNKLLELHKNKFSVVFLVKNSGIDLKASYDFTSGKLSASAKLEAVFFNMLTRFDQQTNSLAPRLAQSDGEPLSNNFLPLAKVIKMEAWLCSDSHKYQNFLDVVAAAGLHIFDTEPSKRQARLERWKENKDKLTLYSLEGKHDNLVLTTVQEKEVQGLDHINNKNLELSLNQLKKNEVKEVLNLDVNISGNISLGGFSTNFSNNFSTGVRL